METQNTNSKSAARQWQEACGNPPNAKEAFPAPALGDLALLYGPPPPADEAEQTPTAEYPGQFPFTRGIHPTMYRGRIWTMRQYSGFATAEESNRRFRYLLDCGQTGLSLAFDLPTQIGYDSDDPMAEGEVGRVGVAVDSLLDMETLLDGIPLDRVSLSMTINSTAAILLAMYVVAAEQQGVDQKVLRGTVQNDLLKEYVARGTYIFPPDPSLRLTADILEYCAAETPKFNPISVSGYHIREAGATAAQEIAFTLADGLAYCRAACERGLPIDRFAPRLSFFFAAHNHFLEETAKFRAARRLWARTMREQYDPQDPKSMQLRFHAQTAGSTLVAQQPYNNIVRVALQALSAVLGGAQSLHTNSWDEALALPSEAAARIALRTQQILAYETGVADTVDPLAGSYCVEALTDRLEREASEYLTRIEDMGGMLEAIRRGYVQQEIQRSAFAYQQQVERGERTIVGQNRFADGPETAPMGLHQADDAVRQRQVDRLKQLRQSRDSKLVRRRLEAVQEAAEGRDNLMPLIIEAVRARATLGEISAALKKVFGTYTPTSTF